MIRVLAAVVVLLTACTRPLEEESTQGVGPITFVDGYDTSSGRRVERLVEEWNARNDLLQEVTFKEMSHSTDAHRAQLMARAQDLAGVADPYAHDAQCYDVMNVDSVWLAAFAEAGYLEPLKVDDFPTDPVLDQAVTGARQGEQRLWAVPWRVDVGQLFYRKDLLDAEGVAPPRTWADLRRLASTLGPKYGMAGYVGQFADYEGVVVNALEAIWAHEGDPFEPDSPNAVAGVRALADGIADGWIPREALEYDEEGSRKAFQAGRALFMRNWPYAGPRLDEPGSAVAGKWDTVALPGPSALGGWNLAVSRCSTHQKTAREFIRFLTGEGTQRELFRFAGWLPSLKALYREPELEPFAEAVRTARTRPTSAYYDELTTVMRRYLRHALMNPNSVDGMMGAIADGVREAERGR